MSSLLAPFELHGFREASIFGSLADDLARLVLWSLLSAAPAKAMVMWIAMLPVMVMRIQSVHRRSSTLLFLVLVVLLDEGRTRTGSCTNVYLDGMDSWGES